MNELKNLRDNMSGKCKELNGRVLWSKYYNHLTPLRDKAGIKVEKSKNTIKELESDINELNTRKEEKESESLQLRTEAAKLADELSKMSKIVEENKKEKDNSDEQIENANKTITNLKQDLENHNRTIQELKADQRKMNMDLSSNNNKDQNPEEARKKRLEELKAEYEAIASQKEVIEEKIVEKGT